MIGNVVVLGLSAAVNPILVGVVLVTLASPRPKALLGAYVAGAMTLALKDIAEAGVSTDEEILAIVLFNVLMLSPALIPLALLVVVPDATMAAVQRSDRWMRDHQKRLVTVVAGAIGTYLTGKGIVALAG